MRAGDGWGERLSSQLFEFVAAQSSERTTVHLGGEIDFAAALEVGPKLEELAASANEELVFDLEDVTFIDSEGLKMLLNAFQLMWRRGLGARLDKLSDRARRVMEMAGVADILVTGDLAASRPERTPAWRIPDPGLDR